VCTDKYEDRELKVLKKNKFKQVSKCFENHVDYMFDNTLTLIKKLHTVPISTPAATKVC